VNDPTKFEVEEGPWLRSPNISRNTVIGFGTKYEMTKKSHQKFRLVSNRSFVKKGERFGR